MDTPRTMLQALHDQAHRLQHRPALWTRLGRTYVPTSWRDYALRVKRLALGLHTLGFRAGDTLPILSFNREEWLVASLAAMALGGVPVGVYTHCSPEQVEYLVEHCRARHMVVENAAHLATALAVRPRVLGLRHLIVLDVPEGPLAPDVWGYADVQALGTSAPDATYWDAVNALRPEALATLIYTSGTTGQPKGVMLSHKNLTWTAERLARVTRARGEDAEDEVVLSYLPLAHIAEQLVSLYVPLLVGGQVYFAQSLESVARDLPDARPTVFFGVPRVWEKLKGRIESALGELPPARRRTLDWARQVTAERQALVLRGGRAPLLLEAQYQLARSTVLPALLTKLGLDRAHFVVTGAAPIGEDVLAFFASIGLVLREVYGQSEVSGPTSLNTHGATRLGSLGHPMMGVEVRIADDGEILVRGGGVCMGYYRDPVATESLLQDGWLHSGDVGRLDGEGYLHITGRKKELIATSGGKKTAPAPIEQRLKALAPVGHAVVIGERRPYLVALLTLDAERVRLLARERGWPEAPGALAEDPRLHEHLRRAIEQEVNPHLSRFETLKRFAVLAEDFTMAHGELTPSLKVRRQAVEARHQALIESLYAGPEAAGVRVGLEVAPQTERGPEREP